ncbi:MAG: hypothetical protein LBJ48_07675, partial [Coriobacteriales bacterium]|nr:hypothetical protein [Coriobacteriales bacterium]
PGYIDQYSFFSAYFDHSGSIKVFLYSQDKYFTGENNTCLQCIYIADVTSTDPLTQYFLNDYETTYPGIKSTFASGYNIIKINWGDNTFIKYG